MSRSQAERHPWECHCNRCNSEHAKWEAQIKNSMVNGVRSQSWDSLAMGSEEEAALRAALSERSIRNSVGKHDVSLSTYTLIKLLATLDQARRANLSAKVVPIVDAKRIGPNSNDEETGGAP